MVEWETVDAKKEAKNKQEKLDEMSGLLLRVGQETLRASLKSILSWKKAVR